MNEERREVRKHTFKMQDVLPYKNVETTIEQLSSDDIDARVNALKQLKSFGSISSIKLIEKIKNNPYKIDAYIVLALYELGDAVYTPVLQNISEIKNIRSLKDLIFLETLIDVIKNILHEKDKKVLYNLLELIERAIIKKGENKLFQSFCRNLKIKIFECLCKFNDRGVYKYIVDELQKNYRFLPDFVLDVLKKYADTSIVKSLLYAYKAESNISELNARLIKEIIKVIYRRNGMNLNDFAHASNITTLEDLKLLNSIIH